METKNIITGKWQTTCWRANVPGGWDYIGQFAVGQSIWEIIPDGTILDSFAGETPELLTYHYDHNARLLVIQRFEVEERYRVEFTDSTHIILYDLEGVDVEPDDYSLRIEMEKVNTGVRRRH